LLQFSDKVGGAPPTIARTRRLNDFLGHTKSFDAHVQGRVFTWKKILQGQLVYEKLDRVIFREDCVQLFPNYLVTNGSFTCSDHAFVLLNTDLAHPPKKGTNFKYQRSWVDYQETHRVVKKNWLLRVHGAIMYRAVQKLKKNKLDLKSWSKTTFGNFKSKLERNDEKLLVVETKLVQDPNNP